MLYFKFISLLDAYLCPSGANSANGLLVWMPEIFNRMATFSKLEPDTSATACQACQAIHALQQLAVNASSSNASSPGPV